MQKYQGMGEGESFFYEDSAGDWIMIPAGAKSITAILDAVGSGVAAKLQVTNDKVGAETNAVSNDDIIDWKDEDHSVTGIFANEKGGTVIGAVAAVRALNSGTPNAKLKVWAVV